MMARNYFLFWQLEFFFRHFFTGPRSNENSWVTESRDTKKFEKNRPKKFQDRSVKNGTFWVIIG